MSNIENNSGTLGALMQTVKERAARKTDYTCPQSLLQVATALAPDETMVTSLILERSGGEPTRILRCNPVALDHLGQRNGLDVRTTRRLQSEYPGEFDQLTKAILDKEDLKHRRESKNGDPKMVMIRAYDDAGGVGTTTGIARALKSAGFKCYDDEDLLGSVLPVLMNSPAQWEVVKAHVTDRRMLCQFKSKLMTGVAKVGQLMAHGLGISNSEVGEGSVVVRELAWELFCLNGMETGKVNRSAHLTRAQGDAETWAILTDEAKEADNHALSLKLRDWTAAVADSDNFEKILEQYRRAGDDIIEGNQLAAVEALGGILKLSKPQTSNVLQGLMDTLQQEGHRGQPVSRATLASAVTNAQHRAKPDDVEDWQRLGAEVINLKANQWASVATAQAVAA